MVAGAPAEPARPVRLAVHLVLGVRRLERPAGQAGCLSQAAEVRDFRAPAGVLGPRLGALCRRRRARRPGAVRARVAGAAPVCDRARHPADRRHPDLRRRDSAETESHAELFSSELVAGAAPDVSHPEGQLWGQPVYDWPAMRREGYRWWIERFRRTLELVDVGRVDHFRGFVAYWAVPRGAKSPLEGRWHRGPGAALFEAVERELGRLPLAIGFRLVAYVLLANWSKSENRPVTLPRSSASLPSTTSIKLRCVRIRKQHCLAHDRINGAVMIIGLLIWVMGILGKHPGRRRISWDGG